MPLRNCADPATCEELRQAKWDAKCEAFPRCAECGDSLLPHETYTELGGRLYCPDCVRSATHLTENLEVL